MIIYKYGDILIYKHKKRKIIYYIVSGWQVIMAQEQEW